MVQSGYRMSRDRIETPCIDVCVVDETTGRCMGCGRTLAQIAAWASISVEERRRIMATLAPGRNAGTGKVDAE
jgi:predicted Fe-S protein YdhL (DUF1289 family)